jgi:hypothetical protein
MQSFSGLGKLYQQFRAMPLSHLCTVNKYFGIRDSLLNTVTRTGRAVWGSNTDRRKIFSPPKSPDLLWAQPSLISMGTRVLSWDLSGRGVKLNTYRHRALRLRMSGALPLFHLLAVMARTGTILYFIG